MIAVIAFGYLGQLCAERGQLDAATEALARADDLLAHVRSSVWIGPIREGQATVELWAGRAPSRCGADQRVPGRSDRQQHIFYTARLYELGAHVR